MKPAILRSFILALVILITQSGTGSFAQNRFEILKDQKVEFNEKSDSSLLVFMNNIRSFEEKDCDSLDMKILLSGPLMGTFLVELTSNKADFTYGDLYDRYMTFKHSPNYPKIRRLYEVTALLETKTPTKENWKQDSVLLAEIGMSATEYTSFKNYVIDLSYPSKTYKELMGSWNKKKESERVFILDSLLVKGVVIDEDSLSAKSTTLKKPILLYFTGYNCVNCRKLEQMVLIDPAISHRLKEDFIFVPLYVDDRTVLPESEWKKSTVRDRILKTVGEKNLEFQLVEYNIMSQPYFVILDETKNILGTADYYQNTVPRFEDFLTRGIKKYNE